jgi:lysophospholipase L1-like esterase
MLHRIKVIAGAAVLAAGTAGITPALAHDAPPPTAQSHRATTTVTTWSASDDKAGGSMSDLTVRNLVHTTIGGSDPQIRISNYFGTGPITFSHAYLGLSQSSASPALVPGSNRMLTFSGSPSVTIPAGAVALSDPLPGPIEPQAELSISLALHGTATVITAHNRSMQYTFKSSTGDYAADESGTPFGTQSSAWYFLDAVVLRDPAGTQTMSALGDSITDGVGSTINANHRWTDYLAHRVDAAPAPHRFGIANEGISGNRLASGGGSTGLPGLTRLTRDALTKPGIGSVFVFEGINDISGGISAADLIAADQQLITQAHADGKCIFASTITPAGFPATDSKEAVRQHVNDYLRGESGFDAVFDFDQTVRDPVNPASLLPADDSGDHIHLSDAGYQAVANSINLADLTC